MEKSHDRYASTIELADALDKAFSASQTMAGISPPSAPATVMLSEEEMPAQNAKEEQVAGDDFVLEQAKRRLQEKQANKAKGKQG